MDIRTAIRTKRAVRRFAAEQVPEESIIDIVDAGRRAGSSKNNQPWHFVVVRDRRRLAELGECGQWAGHLAGAAFAVALVTGDWRERWPVAFDLGRAAQNMMLAAHELGIGSVLANVYEQEQAAEILGLPEDLMCYAAISFGFPADPGELDRPLRSGGRRPMTDVLHWERF